MTYLRLIRGGNRRYLDELEPAIRDRIVALDEPVSRADWDDVLRLSRSRGPLRGHRRAVLLIAAAFALSVAAGFSVALGPLSSSGERSGAAVTRPAGILDLGASRGFSLGTAGAEGPETISLRTSKGRQTLYVFRSGQGMGSGSNGFCYEWPGEARGCMVRAAALRVAWGNGRVVGTVSADEVSSVEIRFTDGTAAVPEISWVSAPLNAGFFLYRIPAGKTVVAVVANDHGVTQGAAPWYGV